MSLASRDIKVYMPQVGTSDGNELHIYFPYDKETRYMERSTLPASWQAEDLAAARAPFRPIKVRQSVSLSFSAIPGIPAQVYFFLD